MEANRILSQEILRRRYKRNKVTISVTFASVMVQLVTNIMVIYFLKEIYGSDTFHHRVVSIIHAGSS